MLAENIMLVKIFFFLYIIRVEDWKEEYITSKIKHKYKTLFISFNLKRNSDIITFIEMHVLNQLAVSQLVDQLLNILLSFCTLVFWLFYTLNNFNNIFSMEDINLLS